jgi:long-chain acyl-CoA synthetase
MDKILDRRPPGVRLTNSRWNVLANTAVHPPQALTQRSVSEVFSDNALLHPDHVFAYTRSSKEGSWNETTWEKALQRTSALAFWLHQYAEVQLQECIGILSSTRIEWVYADLAIMGINAISTSIYHSLPAKDAGYIIEDSNVKVLFVENEEQLLKLESLEKNGCEIPDVEDREAYLAKFQFKKIISFEKIENAHFADRLIYIEDIYTSPGIDEHWFFGQLKTVHPESLASLVYTSGTTGAPKGVMQTHNNHLKMIDSVIESGLMGDGEKIFLYLPLAHSFARICCYAAIAPCGSLIFPYVVNEKRSVFDPRQILADVASSNPKLFPSVPRIFEKMMDSLNDPKQRRTKFIHFAIRNRDKKGFRGIIAKKILSAVRNKLFGNSLQYCVSGGAPLGEDVLDFFDSIGIQILQGYGLTETTPASHANTQRYNSPGTVGRAFPCNDVQIANDGEILIRGANVALGYWKRPIATKEAWSHDGWFYTGDIGEIDEQGYLKITDRKKDLIVTAGGKKIPPTFIEAQIKTSSYISQAVVIGDKKPYLVAIITINPEASRLSTSEEITKKIYEHMLRLNENLASFETIKKFHVLEEDFTIENGLLSPTLKVKRKMVIERYKNEIEVLFSSKSE